MGDATDPRGDGERQVTDVAGTVAGGFVTGAVGAQLVGLQDASRDAVIAQLATVSVAIARALVLETQKTGPVRPA